MKRLVLALWLVCLPLLGAELKLPTSPVEPYTLIRMQVVDATSIDDVMVMTVRNNEVSFVDLETSASPGTYVFTGPPGVYSIRVKVKDFAPLVGRLEVRGVVPFPPTPPVPPNPPEPPVPPVPVTKGLVWTIVIRTSDTLTADQSQVLSDLRQWSDQQPKDKVLTYEFSPKPVGPSGEPDTRAASWVARIPPGETHPYAFLAQKDASGKPNIVWQGKLPATAAELIAKISERL